MNRAVVDTNVLVRALIKPAGTVGELIRALREGKFTLVYSPPLIEELVEVLARPRITSKYRVSTELVRTLLQLIVLRGEEVRPARTIRLCRDPKDDKVLEAAVAGGADVIVSTDRDLLVLSPFQGIPVLGPAEFLALL